MSERTRLEKDSLAAKKRLETIKEAYLQWQTLDEIASSLEMTRQGVHQIIEKAGCTTEEWRTIRKEKLDREVEIILDRTPKASIQFVCTELALPREWYNRVRQSVYRLREKNRDGTRVIENRDECS